ncbi:T9SS type A sorting domain-containing protein [candidate division WOR-3 bacterium]|nr:T9SS type A sorting domain-containing protein [candidate division WOR-3 bacterium]
MKVKFFIIISFLLVSTALFGTQTSLLNTRVEVPFRGLGGPDSFGYTWIDSDEPGGPTYNWIDITGIGTQVTGLSDDNNAGPFPLGFDFPYYWYKVNQFWVNSNGAISFSDAEVYIPQGSSTFLIPNTAAPNDIVVPLGADLTFERPDSGEVYYYSNNIDTFIISYIDVPAWVGPGAPEGAHTFQLILTKQDSCIYFMYSKQEGGFYNNQNISGMEDVMGRVGLKVFANTVPDSGYAVKFTPPDSTNYQALDIGVMEAISPRSKGVFLLPVNPYTLWVTVRNYGNVDAGTFTVPSVIWDPSYIVFFADTITVSGLAAGAETTLYFTPDWWTPASANDYKIWIQTQLPGDMNASNNSKDVELIVVDTPGWLTYDRDPTSGNAWAWSGAGGGNGKEFVPPQYPMTIDSVLVTLSSTDNVDVPILFLDDDGPNGSPGTLLYADTIFVPAGTSFEPFTISIPAGVNTITSGAFFVGMIQLGDSFPRLCSETQGPFSRRDWEFTGAWVPSRNKDTDEFLIRAYTSTAGINEGKFETKSFALALLPIHPNPFKGNTRIHYALPSDANVSLKVYNLLGQEVRTLVNGNEKSGIHSVTFDAKDSNGNKLPQGIYFYRLTVGKRSLTRKLTILR